MGESKRPFGGKSYKGSKAPGHRRPNKGKGGVWGSARPLARFGKKARRQRRK